VWRKCLARHTSASPRLPTAPHKSPPSPTSFLYHSRAQSISTVGTLIALSDSCLVKKPQKPQVTSLRRGLAATLACYFAGCAASPATTKYQFNQIKRDMTREEVIADLGEPIQTSFVSGAPTEDIYTCDQRGGIVWVTDTDLAFTNSALEIKECVVHYEQGRVVNTSQKNGPISSWICSGAGRSKALPPFVGEPCRPQ
jgi:hypothetical protein